jgi:hypothetical protein
MPRACSLCTHPDRLAVEAALRAQMPLRTIATSWSVSKTALLRHRENHGSPQAHADQAVPPIAPPATAPHTLASCAVALLEHCLPEVRERFEEAATRLEWPLDLLVVTGLYEYVQHLDQCPRSTAGPER